MMRGRSFGTPPHPNPWLFATHLAQQFAIAAAHQGKAGLHKADGPVTQVMGLPGPFGDAYGAKQALCDRAIAIALDPGVERAQRQGQSLSTLWGQFMKCGTRGAPINVHRILSRRDRFQKARRAGRLRVFVKPRAAPNGASCSICPDQGDRYSHRTYNARSGSFRFRRSIARLRMSANRIWKTLCAGLCGSAAHSGPMFLKYRMGLPPSFQPYEDLQQGVERIGWQLASPSDSTGAFIPEWLRLARVPVWPHFGYRQVEAEQLKGFVFGLLENRGF